MEVKLFEVRDRGTFVPMMAVRVVAHNAEEHYLLRRSGYGLPSHLVILTGLDAGSDKATCDPHDWGMNGTRFTAHQYIMDHWDELKSSQVICTEYIRGERDTPKKTERVTYTIDINGPSITCHICNKTSYNTNDVREKYCGFCHMYHEP